MDEIPSGPRGAGTRALAPGLVRTRFQAAGASTAGRGDARMRSGAADKPLEASRPADAPVRACEAVVILYQAGAVSEGQRSLLPSRVDANRFEDGLE